MRSVAMQFNKTVMSALVGGLLLGGLLAACSEVYVNVDTASCPSGPRVIKEPPPPGACTPATLASDTQATSINAYDSVTMTRITDTTLKCKAGGTKCLSGTCGYTPCRTWYKASTTHGFGDCTCGCSPP
jgi:hypothetical protein